MARQVKVKRVKIFSHVFPRWVSANDAAGRRELHDAIKRHIGVFVAAAKDMTVCNEPNLYARV